MLFYLTTICSLLSCQPGLLGESAAGPQGAGQVLGGRILVPLGSYTQGSERQPDAPPRTVTLQPFEIDASEVTVAQFEAWAQHGYAEQRDWSEAGWAWRQAHPQGMGAQHRAAGRGPAHPVVAVSWFEAEAYCAAHGGHLPTEAQWERAACGGLERDYPWGDSQEVVAVWYDGGKFGILDSVKTQPAGQQSAELRSPEGAMHMAGNVWEWTADWYGPWEGDAREPSGPESGSWRVLKGGSYMNLPSYCACQHREPRRPEQASYTAGFRCAY